MNTLEINFDDRKEEANIEFRGGINEVSEGCRVDLEHQGVRITAKVTKYTPGEPWVGEVTDFAQDATDQVTDLKIGSTIHFEERHIHSCAA